jgi:hypothetical protein
VKGLYLTEQIIKELTTLGTELNVPFSRICVILHIETSDKPKSASFFIFLLTVKKQPHFILRAVCRI